LRGTVWTSNVGAMLTILDELEIRQQAYPVTVEFYHELGRLGMIDESVELLEGVIVTKMSKSSWHEGLVRRLARLIRAVLPSGTFLSKESPITMGDSEPEPDLAVIAGDEEDFNDEHPTTALLVIEVALSTLKKDARKAAIYAAAGVQEYWIIDPDNMRLIQHLTPSAEGYVVRVVHGTDAVVVSAFLARLSVDVAALFAR
jgi:Uma2 family endonuclease